MGRPMSDAVASPYEAAARDAFGSVLGADEAQRLMSKSAASSGNSKPMASPYEAAAREAFASTLGKDAGESVLNGRASQPAAEDKRATLLAEKRSMLDSTLRQLGLFTRHAVNGVAALPAMAADALVTTPVNAALDAVRGKGNGARLERPAKALDDALTMVGLPQPENATERVVGDATSAMAGAGGMVKAGQALASGAGKVASAVGEKLAEGAGMQIGSAASGAGAAGLTREMGGTEGAQLAAGLAGGLAPSVVPYSVNGAVRGAVRGGEAGRQKMADNIKMFDEAAGVTPTLGQATGSPRLQAVESLLEKTPGSVSRMNSVGRLQNEKMQESLDRLTKSLSSEPSSAMAGEAIERGVNKFRDAFKAQQTKLYDALDSHIPSSTPIQVGNAKQALTELNAAISGAENVSGLFQNPKIASIQKALTSDLESSAQTGTLPYASVKKLRSLVGQEIEAGALVSDAPQAAWKRLYGALSTDLADAATAAGPAAEQAWKKANDYTKSELGKLSQLEKIVGKDSPEKIFQAALAGSREGPTVISRVMSALPQEDRREVAGAVLRRMGQANPGAQNAAGEAFNSETFLTNLSKMSPEARNVIFKDTGVTGVQDRVKLLAEMASNRREGANYLKNPSGTATVAGQIGLASALSGGMATAATTGNIVPLAGAVGVPVIANGIARAVTSPSLVRGFAEETVLPSGAAGSSINAALTSIERMRQDSADDLHEKLSAIGRAETVGDAIAAASGATKLQPVPITGSIRNDGSYVLYGDTKEIRAKLQEAGIANYVPMRGGVMVGRSDAPAAYQLFNGD